MNREEYQLPAHALLSEPELVFHPTRDEDRDEHPLRGLDRFGPYSRSLINPVVDPIRVASIVPSGERKTVLQLLSELEGKHVPKERKSYLIDFPGFSRVFGLRIVPGPPSVHIELPAALGQAVKSSDRPHMLMADQMTQALSALLQSRGSFDVVLIYLPDEWKLSFTGGDADDFDLHDYIKATAAAAGIPTQLLQESSALGYYCRASVAWRLGIALYTKAGGVPWKLADADPDTAFIGLSYAMRGAEHRGPRFVTCCSQVFDSDGAGLEFLTYDTADAHIERENPFLTRPDMRRVMSHSLSLYQRRHAGRLPRRVVIHKTSEFKTDEVDGCFDAWRSAEGLELVQVQDSVSWRGIQLDPPTGGQLKGQISSYPVFRGTYQVLGTRELLLWTQGNAPTAVGGKNFFKEGKGIPGPILLKRFAGQGGWAESARAALGLTKMDWNNDSLYDRLPVTLSFASVLADTIKRMPSLSKRPYEFRFFM